MKLRGHGSAVAISLAAAALVVAGTGTAVAVVASTVNIVDPDVPARAVHVDSAGRLQVVGPASKIAASGLLSNYQSGDNFITSPTTATLGITKVMLSETAANAGVAGNAFRIYLYKVGVDSSGSCTSAGYEQLAIYQFGAGETIVDPSDAPLTVRATGGAKYCLDMYSTQLGGSSALNYFPAYNLTATLLSGTYAGIGVAAKPAAEPAQVQGQTDAQ